MTNSIHKKITEKNSRTERNRELIKNQNKKVLSETTKTPSTPSFLKKTTFSVVLIIGIIFLFLIISTIPAESQVIVVTHTGTIHIGPGTLPITSVKGNPNISTYAIKLDNQSPSNRPIGPWQLNISCTNFNHATLPTSIPSANLRYSLENPGTFYRYSNPHFSPELVPWTGSGVYESDTGTFEGNGAVRLLYSHTYHLRKQDYYVYTPNAGNFEFVVPPGTPAGNYTAQMTITFNLNP